MSTYCQCPVHIDYFRERGKFYSSSEGDMQWPANKPLFELWEDLAVRRALGVPMPGLINNAPDYYMVISCPGHPHDHPHLFRPLAK